jgi:hypothetical protein
MMHPNIWCSPSPRCRRHISICDRSQGGFFVRIRVFVNSTKYLGIIFDKRVTRRLHLEMIKAKISRSFIRIFSLFKSERLITNIKMTLHKALIRNIMTYACPAWEIAPDHHLLKLQAPAKQSSPHHWKYSKVHTASRFAHGFQTSVHI